MKTKNSFVEPDFSKAKLEFRFEENVICIYGTQEGLQWLIKQCENLISDPGQGHIHINANLSRGLVTQQSLEVAVAIFTSKLQ